MAAGVLVASSSQQLLGWAAQPVLDAAQILLPGSVHWGIFHHVGVRREALLLHSLPGDGLAEGAEQRVLEAWFLWRCAGLFELGYAQPLSRGLGGFSGCQLTAMKVAGVMD
jgi:hypothetical protein